MVLLGSFIGVEAATVPGTRGGKLPAIFLLKTTLRAEKKAAGPARIRFGRDAGGAIEIRFFADHVMLAPGNRRPPVQLPKALGKGAVVVLIREGKELALVVDDRYLTHWTIDGRFTTVDVTDGAGVRLETPRVQRSAPAVFGDDFMRSGNDQGKWTASGGTWKLDRIANPGWSANAFRMRADGSGLLRVGHWFWRHYGVRAAMRPGPQTEGAGIGLNIDDDGDGVFLYWSRDRDTAAESGTFVSGAFKLVSRRARHETVLAQQRGVLDTSQWYELTLIADGKEAVAFVDRRRLFSSKIDDPFGKVGLWVENAAAAQFDDVLVRGWHSGDVDFSTADSALQTAVFGRRIAPVANRFVREQKMRTWAGPWASWRGQGVGAKTDSKETTGKAGPEIRWHIGTFTDDLVMRWRRDKTSGPLTLVQACSEEDPKSGYALVVADTVRLLRRGRELASAPMPKAPAGTILWQRRGGRHTVLYGKSELLTVSDREPLAGGRAGFVAAEKAPSVDAFEIESDTADDYTFYSAATDWRSAGGEWTITSRWPCMPNWSWYGGSSNEAAVLWSKRSYHGDQVVDLHAATMMTGGKVRREVPSGYLKFGDINLTICSDGVRLDSGYTLMLGGFGNSRTCLWRRGRIVAERNDRLYPTKDHHRTWRNVRAEKIGSEIRFLFNDELILSYKDPNPIPGGHVAVWTWDAGIMIPRIRMFAGRVDAPASPFGRPSPGPRAAEANPYSARAVVVTEKSVTFASALSGGDLTSPLPVPVFDARRRGLLSFDYRFPPELKVHLYIEANGEDFFVRLNGPDEPADHWIREALIMPGRVINRLAIDTHKRRPVRAGTAEVKADDRWHSLRIDLGRALAPFFPHAPKIEVNSVSLANWCNTDYLMCGFGGNRPGLEWALRKVKLARSKAPAVIARPSPAFDAPLNLDTSRWRRDTDSAPVAVQWDGAGRGGAGELTIRAGPRGFGFFVLDRMIDTVRHPVLRIDYAAPRPVPFLIELFTARREEPRRFKPPVKLVFDGEWHTLEIPLKRLLGRRKQPLLEKVRLSLKPLVIVGEPVQLRLANLRLETDNFADDTEAPSLEVMAPAKNGPGVGGDVVFMLKDGASGIDRASVSVRIGDREFLLNNPQVTVRPSPPGAVRVSVRLEKTPADGERIDCTVQAHDRAGNALPAQQKSWHWIMDYKGDRTAPAAPYVAYIPSRRLVWDAFETDEGQWFTHHGAFGRRSTEFPATGSFCFDADGFQAIARYSSYDARRYPIVRLDYRILAGHRMDLVIASGDQLYLLGFNLFMKHLTTLGKVDDVKIDGRWHRAEFDLERLFQKLDPNLTDIVIDSIGMACVTKSGRWYDNFTIAERRETEPIFEWTDVVDVTGIAGWSVVIDRKPDTIPDETIDTVERRKQFGQLAPAQWFLHVRGRDGAGNWGPTGHAKAVVTEQGREGYEE